MFVSNVMVEAVQSVSPDDSLQQAYDLIQTTRHDCLPVMGPNKSLVGIIQLTDIYEACMKHGRQVALPMQIKEVMTSHIATVTPGDLIEKAAKLMWERDIPLLPVVDEGRLVGVIGEDDIFASFAEMLGVNSGTTRLTLLVPDRRGQLARVAEIIRDAGIMVTHVATWHSKVFEQYKMVVRVEVDSSKPLVQLLEQHGYKVIHVDVD